jgi:hypothetical protein
MIKECVREKEMLGIRISYVIFVPRAESRHVASLLGLLHQSMEATHSSRSGGLPSLLPCHTGWIDAAIVRAQPPLTVNGVPHSLDGEEVKAPITPRTILNMGSERPLRFPLRYKQ